MANAVAVLYHVFYPPFGKSTAMEYITISETTAKFYHPCRQDAGGRAINILAST